MRLGILKRRMSQSSTDGRKIRMIACPRSRAIWFSTMSPLSGRLASTAPALAAKAATSTIPIVFRFGVDPVRVGLVASLNKPGGNITGVASLSAEMDSKRFEFIHQMVPGATSVAALVNPASLEQEARIREWEEAARVLGIRLLVLNTSSAREIEEAFATMARQKIEALRRSAGCILFRPASSTRRLGGPLSYPGDLSCTRNRRGWRPHELRAEHC